MSYLSVINDPKIENTFDAYDHLTFEARKVLETLGVGPMQVVTCGLDRTKRTKRITGTDLPKMFGLVDAKYGDYRTVLAEKLGILKPDYEETMFTRVGKYMEPFLVSALLEDHAEQMFQIAHANPNTRWYITLGENHEHAHLNFACSTDLCLYLEDELVLLGECKHTGASWSDIPDKVMVQVQGQMMCADKTTAFVKALIGGNREEKTWQIMPEDPWIKAIKDAVIKATKIILEGKLPPALVPPTIVKPKTKPTARVTSTWMRLANALVEDRDGLETMKAHADRINAILDRHFKVDETISSSAFSATKFYKNFQPSLNEKKALPQIEEALLDLIPEKVRDEARKKIHEIRSACTSDGSQVVQFQLRRKGEK